MNIFNKKKVDSTPLLIIKMDSDETNIKKYKSIEDAIADIENYTTVPHDKIERLRTSLKELKTSTSITIRNGEIIK